MKIETKFEKGDTVIHLATNEAVEVTEIRISVPVKMPGNYNGVSYLCLRPDGTLHCLQEEWLTRPISKAKGNIKVGDRVGFNRTALSV